ncbi:hypothetical protein CR513_30832, partial [Mucuna pruriens]
MEEGTIVTIVGIHSPLGKRGVKDIRRIGGRKLCERHDRREEDRMDELEMNKCNIPSFLCNWKLEVRLVTLAFGDYALILWTTMLDDMRRGIIEPCERVQEYGRVHKEMEMDLLRSQLRDSEEAIMARFLHGTLLVHQAVKVEIQLRRRSASRRSIIGSSSLRGRDREKEKARSERSPKKGSEPFQGFTPSPNAPKSSNIKCFNYLGKCHIAFQHPNRKAMIMRDDGEVASESSHGETFASRESKSHSNDSHFEGDLWIIGDEAKTHIENIFHSRCLVLGNLCSIIIDGGWLSKHGELVVNRQVGVSFTLGSCEDKVLCDVVPMEFDRKVTHNGVTNRFTFVHMGQKVVLKPLSPREVQKHQNKMREKRNKKVEKRETKTKRKRKKGIRRHVDTWGDLKCELKSRFVLASYARDLYNKLQRTYQGSKCIEEYLKDMEVALMRANVLESNEAIMTRYTSGGSAKEAPDHKEDLSQLPQQLKEQREGEGAAKKGEESKEGELPTLRPKKERMLPSPDPMSKSSNIKCSKCLGKGPF